MAVVLIMHLSVFYLLLVVLLYLLQQVICTELLPPAVCIQTSCTKHTRTAMVNTRTSHQQSICTQEDTEQAKYINTEGENGNRSIGTHLNVVLQGSCPRLISAESVRDDDLSSAGVLCKFAELFQDSDKKRGPPQQLLSQTGRPE